MMFLKGTLWSSDSGLLGNMAKCWQNPVEKLSLFMGLIQNALRYFQTNLVYANTTVANVSNYKFRVGWCQCIMDLIIESASKQVCCKIDQPDV